MGYGPYNKTRDTGRAEWQGVRHESLEPKSPEDIRDWLDDTGVIPAAEVYRNLKSGAFGTELSAATTAIYGEMMRTGISASEGAARYVLGYLDESDNITSSSAAIPAELGSIALISWPERELTQI
jgi:hypothetical protein